MYIELSGQIPKKLTFRVASREGNWGPQEVDIFHCIPFINYLNLTFFTICISYLFNKIKRRNIIGNEIMNWLTDFTPLHASLLSH